MWNEENKLKFVKRDVNNNVMCKLCIYAIPMYEGASIFACEHPKYKKFENKNDGSYICGYGIKWTLFNN